MKPSQLFLGLGISAVFLYLALSNLDHNAIRDSFRQMTPLWILLAALVHLASFILRSVRWGVMLKHMKAISLHRLFPAVAISYLANNVLPLRAGELVRAYLLARSEGISKTATFSSIVLERIFDGITLLLFLCAVLLLAPLPGWAKQSGVIAGAIFLSILLLMLGLVFLRVPTLRGVRFMVNWLPPLFSSKLEGILLKFVSGLDVLKDGRALLKIALWSLGVWGCEALAIAFTLRASGNAESVLMVLFTLAMINFGTMIPSSPGYIGTFEFFCTKSLFVFGMPASKAMAIALALHAVQYFPITLTGIYFCLRQSFSMKDLMLGKGSLG